MKMKMKNYKRLILKSILLIPFIIVVLCFTGCDKITLDILSTMSPPKITENEKLLQDTINKTLPKGYTLIYPSEQIKEGVMYEDLNSDNIDEAIIFYLDKKDSFAKISIFSFHGNKWSHKATVSDDGYDIDSVTAYDIDGDNEKELFVGWRLYDKENKGLSVYKISNGVKEIFTDSYTKYIYDRVGNSGEKNLFIFKNDSKLAQVYKYSNGSFSIVDEKKLIDDNSSIIKIMCDFEATSEYGQNKVIYIDFALENERKYTQVLEFNNNIISLSGDNEENYNITLGNSKNPCDKLIGSTVNIFSTDRSFNSEYPVTRVYNYSKGKFNEISRILLDRKYGFYLNFSKVWEENLKAVYNDKENEMSFYDKNENDKMLFKIKGFTKNEFEKNSDNFTILDQSGNIVLATQIFKENSLWLEKSEITSENSIKNNFVKINY